MLKLTNPLLYFKTVAVISECAPNELESVLIKLLFIDLVKFLNTNRNK